MNNLSKQVLDIINEFEVVPESVLRHHYFANHDNREVQMAIDELVDFREVSTGRNMLGKTLVSNK